MGRVVTVTPDSGAVGTASYCPGVPVKVKEAIRRVEGAGWELARTRGSHR